MQKLILLRVHVVFRLIRFTAVLHCFLVSTNCFHLLGRALKCYDTLKRFLFSKAVISWNHFKYTLEEFYFHFYMQLRLLPGIPFIMLQETFYRNVTRYLWLACNVLAHGLCQIENGGVSIHGNLSLTQTLTEGPPFTDLIILYDKQELLRTYTYLIYKFRSWD